MLKTVSFSLILVVSAPAVLAAPQVPAGYLNQNSEIAHGGGCRKSSPPGQCCHMQKSTGKVHCH